MPALTPEDVQTLPSTTQRAVGIQLTFGPSATVSFHEALLAVALRPSRTPALAASMEPVQTVRKYWTESNRSAMKSIVALRNGEREPRPPGTMSTSSSGAVSSVCVGTTSWKKVEFFGFMRGVTGRVVTGSMVSAIRARFM